MPKKLDAAMDEARRAGDGGPMDDWVARMAERVGAKASVKAVFGEPIERDGLTIIPVAKVRWGFGGGAGAKPIAAGQGEPTDDDGGPMDDTLEMSTGAGGGGGAFADPIGYIEIGPDGAEFKPIVPAMPSPGFMLAVGATAAMFIRAIARLLRG